MGFDDVIAPLGRDAFLREHWGAAFARMPGEPGRFAGLLTWDELNAALEQHRLAPPRLVLFSNGRQVPPEQYLTPPEYGVPRIDSGRFAVCLAQGATLVLNDAQQLAPRVRELAFSFQEALQCDVHVNLYASWKTQNGFDVHWDAQESVVVQLCGRKRWQVYRPTRLHPLLEDAEPPERPTDPPVWAGVLEDGDALYIPRGWWHLVLPMDEPSLHLTISTTPPHGGDFLRWVVSRVLENADARRNLPRAGDAAGQTEYAAAVKDLVLQAMQGDALTEFVRLWEAGIGPNPHIRLPGAPLLQLAPLTERSRLRLSLAQKLMFKRLEAGLFEFAANGSLYAVHEELVAALSLLRHRRDTTFGELLAKTSGQAAREKLEKSLGVMARAGILLID